MNLQAHFLGTRNLETFFYNKYLTCWDLKGSKSLSLESLESTSYPSLCSFLHIRSYNSIINEGSKVFYIVGLHLVTNSSSLSAKNSCWHIPTKLKTKPLIMVYDNLVITLPIKVSGYTDLHSYLLETTLVFPLEN